MDITYPLSTRVVGTTLRRTLGRRPLRQVRLPDAVVTRLPGRGIPWWYGVAVTPRLISTRARSITQRAIAGPPLPRKTLQRRAIYIRLSGQTTLWLSGADRVSHF